jgi:hypothetical protein
MEREIKIVRMELYPADEPTGYAVGFSYGVNNRQGYMDTTVSLEEAKDKTQEEIANIALDKLKSGISQQLIAWEAKSPLIGTSMVLTEDEPEEEIMG